MAAMDQEALQDLARIRAQGDSKNLKRALKSFYRLLSPSLSGPELEAAHETFLMDLNQLTMQLSKTERLERVTQTEVLGYQDEARSIEAMQLETAEKIKSLKARLVIAQRDRGRAIQYDGLAKVVSKLPDQAQGLETQQKLGEDIAVLREEQKTYKQTWRARQDAFDEIVQSLTTMSEAIADEKNEQERRRALDDDAVLDEPPASSSHLDPLAEPFAPPSTARTPPPDETAKEDGEEGEEMDDHHPEEERRMEGVELEEGQEREEKEEGEMEVGP